MVGEDIARAKHIFPEDLNPHCDLGHGTELEQVNFLGLTPHCDLDLEDMNPNFSFDTSDQYDASTLTVTMTF